MFAEYVAKHQLLISNFILSVFGKIFSGKLIWQAAVTTKHGILFDECFYSLHPNSKELVKSLNLITWIVAKYYDQSDLMVTSWYTLKLQKVCWCKTIVTWYCT